MLCLSVAVQRKNAIVLWSVGPGEGQPGLKDQF